MAGILAFSVSRSASDRGRRQKRHGSRKVLGLPLLVLLGCLPLQPAPGGDAPAVIRIWDHHVHDKKFKKEIFKEFNKANPDVKIEYTSQIGSTMPTLLQASFVEGSPPDIFVNFIGMAKAIEMGWILPLEQVAPSMEEFVKWRDKFPKSQQPFAENANMFGGKTYSWPFNAEGGYMMLYWNTGLFREAGLKGPDGGAAVPETWADMRQFARKITELGQKKTYGIIHGLKNPGVWDQDVNYSLANAAGWPNVRGFDFRTASYDLHHPGFLGAIQLWLDMKADGSIFPGDLSMDDEQAKFRFAQGLAGMIFGGYWVPGGILAITDTLEFDTMLPPTPEKGVRKGYLGIGILANNSELVVSSKVKSREAAWKVIEFLTSKEYQEGWVKAGGGFSVFPEYNKSKYFPHPTLAKIAEMATTGRRTAPSFPVGHSKVFEIMNLEVREHEVIETEEGIWIGKLGFEAFEPLEKRLNAGFEKALAEARKIGINLTRADYTFPDWDPAENYPPSKKGK